MSTPLDHLGRRLSTQILGRLVGPRNPALRYSNDGLPYQIALPSVTVSLQCLNPEETGWVWGLHSLMYQSGVTHAPWPYAIAPDKTTPADLEELFGKPAFTMPGVLLFKPAGQERQVTVEFDRPSRKLTRLSITHTGAYGPILPGTEDPPPIVAAPPPPPPSPSNPPSPSSATDNPSPPMATGNSAPTTQPIPSPPTAQNSPPNPCSRGNAPATS